MLELISIHIPKTAGRSFLAILNAVYGNAAVAHFDKKNYEGIAPFKVQLSKQVKVIHGHFIYDEIKDLNTTGNAKVITWLRSPVERVISNYSFFKKRISQAPEDRELQRRKNESLMEYAAMENSRNRMAKFLDGIALDEIYFIGFTESFDADVKQLGEMLNWKSFDVPIINVNAEFKSQLPGVTAAEKKIIEELNRDDMELYEKAMELRKKRMN